MNKKRKALKRFLFETITLHIYVLEILKNKNKTKGYVISKNVINRKRRLISHKSHLGTSVSPILSTNVIVIKHFKAARYVSQLFTYSQCQVHIYVLSLITSV